MWSRSTTMWSRSTTLSKPTTTRQAQDPAMWAGSTSLTEYMVNIAFNGTITIPYGPESHIYRLKASKAMPPGDLLKARTDIAVFSLKCRLDTKHLEGQTNSIRLDPLPISCPVTDKRGVPRSGCSRPSSSVSHHLDSFVAEVSLARHQ